MTKAAEWAERVKEWQASGQRSREFCEGRGYSATNLLWWSSRFRREGFPSKGTAEGEVALLRVVRRAEVAAQREASTSPGSAVIVEMCGACVRVEAGADRATVAMVLELLRSSVGEGAQ